MAKFQAKFSTLKTDAERAAFAQSDEAEAAMRSNKNYPAILQPDGSFHAEDVQPGSYEVSFQPRMPGVREWTNFTSVRELVVPASRDDNDATVVDWGGVEMTNHVISLPTAR
jgi:hypothetical protein